MAKSFHLRWNNHLSNLRTLLEYLYNEQSFVDVTLSCSDGMLRAHKLVLSACSPYFEGIFRENPCKHPTVILKGISLREMQLIIEYMYVGSVDVPESELPSLLEIAQELHVKGLVAVNSDEDDGMSSENKLASPSSSQSSDGKIESSSDNEIKPLSNGTVNYTKSELQQTNKSIKIENDIEAQKLENGESLCNILNIVQMNTDDGSMLSNLHHVDYMLDEEEVGDISCTVCKRGFHNKQNMKRHMQTHSGVKPHQCTFCTQSFLRYSHLQRHLRVHTGERPFNCVHCDKHFSRSDKLKQHVAQQHSSMVEPKMKKQRGRPKKIEDTIQVTYPWANSIPISVQPLGIQ